MVFQGWATLLSLLVSGSMIFTLVATLVLYTQYKLSQRGAKPAEVAVTQPATSGLMNLEQAMITLQESHLHKTHEFPSKRKIRLGASEKRVILGNSELTVEDDSAVHS